MARESRAFLVWTKMRLAIPVAAALSNRHPFRNVCAVVSGGNLDPVLLAKILRGEHIDKVKQ